MIVNKSSIFPTDIDNVWKRLQKLKYLRYVAYPYATFHPAEGKKQLIWKEGRTFPLEFRLYGVIPFGIHTVHIVTIDEKSHMIYSNESNPHVPVWNHRITLTSVGQNHTKYTDKVEIDAGWKTPFIFLWANAFYAHRQKKWIKLFQRMDSTDHPARV